MTSEFDVKTLAEQCKGSGKTFAEFLGELFKDTVVEIYLGDSYEEVSMEQISVSYPAVFCGKIVAAYKECLIISAAYVDKKQKQLKFGKLMFISERAIRALSPVDGKGILEDMFLRSRESLDVKSNFDINK